VGPDEAGIAAPVIEACWAGFVDLQSQPELAWHLPEAAQFPALAEALVELNCADSPVWSAKCDYWPQLERGEFDPDEMDAPPGRTAYAMGCYIDLLPKNSQQWASAAMAETAGKGVCSLLRAVPLQYCRADLVIRRAFIAPELIGFGVTAYVTACGESLAEAAKTLQAALAALTDAFRGHSTVE